VDAVSGSRDKHQAKGVDYMQQRLLAASTLAIVALAGGIFAVTLDGKTPAAPATVVRTTAAPRTINISGTLTLARPGFVWDSTTSTCTGQNGYDDIHGGAQVVVTNPAGVTVAIGHLGDGEPMSDPGATIAYGCALPFSVTAPAGLGFYGVEISHRGRVQYGEKDVQQALSLTLG